MFGGSEKVIVRNVNCDKYYGNEVLIVRNTKSLIPIFLM